eukprot:566156-Pelagomonas_calceolata.AAC.4
MNPACALLRIWNPLKLSFCCFLPHCAQQTCLSAAASSGKHTLAGTKYNQQRGGCNIDAGHVGLKGRRLVLPAGCVPAGGRACV